MKRAEVYRDEVWRVHVRDGVIHDRHLAIKDRWVPSGDDDTYPTHAEALTAALEAVGLTPSSTDKEQA